jgi:predicted anti-sigma-YlaC factor YlaD
MPEARGGSPDRARQHFRRAVELAGGQNAGTFVTMAESVSVAEQNRAEFEQLLEQALAVDPDEETSSRLANLIAQKRARHLLAQADDLFVE